jgi:GT2 family glycosyltransferase
MPNIQPQVSAMIATRNRPSELLLTLQQLKQLDYPNLEIIVIDDASDEPIEPVVRSIWPDARVIRHEQNTGQCQRRNEGFQLASGTYILHLDDDCCFTQPQDLEKAVSILQAHQEAGVLAPYLYNGTTLPAQLPNGQLQPGFVPSYVGAAALIRTDVIRKTVGYRAFFGNEWEEEELCLQLLGKGYGVWFEPSLVAHHRFSSLNRNTERTWMRGLRNRCWAILMHMPWRRVPIELTWKLALGAWDAVRMGRPLVYCRSLGQVVPGLGRALQLREPLDAIAIRRYDAIRLHPFLTEQEFAQPKDGSWRDLAIWWRRWRNRARDKNIWDKAPGGKGTSYTVGYAHEHKDTE